MKNLRYIFDLDGTVTLTETLPVIAAQYGIEEQIDALTRDTVAGRVPFIESFLSRVELLSKFNVSEIAKLLERVPLNETLVSFINQNAENCAIATGNYEGWLSELRRKIACKFFLSEGKIENGRVRLTKILRKESVVEYYQQRGDFVVYIGDGNNDAEAMRIADISIACGIVHEPAESVIQAADFIIYDTNALVRLLNNIKQPSQGRSCVISCAGVGSRLGLGVTKALIQIGGRSMIAHQLSQFSGLDDIRIVVGFQQRAVIKSVLAERRDVVFAVNNDFFNSKTGASLFLGARFSREYVLAYDGDFLVHPDDLRAILLRRDEFICCVDPSSSNPVYVQEDDCGLACAFTSEPSNLEWSGPAQIRRDRIEMLAGHVYEMLESHLPLPVMKVRGTDIDTEEDYRRAKILFSDWYYGNVAASIYYDKLAQRATSPLVTRNKSQDFSRYDAALVRRFSQDGQQSLLDLGSGTGLLVNVVEQCFKEVLAVEKYKEFSDYISENAHITVINADIRSFRSSKKFDVVTIFGVMNFFSNDEARKIYATVREHCVAESGTLIVKHQMGISKDVVVNGHSDELGEYYFSEYRHIDHEVLLLEQAGFSVVERVDIYPREFNRWKDTKFFALICAPVS